MMDASARLRSLLASAHIVAAPGAHDPMTARIVELAGFAAVYLGGNALALGIGKAQPFITLTETAGIVADVARSVELPLIVDAGAGFGDPAHVHAAVRELEAAGAAALHIDDQPYPKSPDYHRGRGRLAAVSTVVARYRAALKARRNAELMIMARTDALRVTQSLDETIQRARAYADAEVDALIVLDLTPDQAARLRDAVPGLPLIWIGGVSHPIPTASELEAAGFAAALYPFNGIAEVATRLAELWERLRRDGTIVQDSARLARARAETARVVDMQRYWDIEDAGGTA
jgi:2-methylisocitrate lyase-like PEP mutase family enzyme